MIELDDDMTLPFDVVRGYRMRRLDRANNRFYCERCKAWRNIAELQQARVVPKVGREYLCSRHPREEG